MRLFAFIILFFIVLSVAYYQPSSNRGYEGPSTLNEAVQGGSLEAVRKMLDEGMSPDGPPEPKREPFLNGPTPLELAMQLPSPDMALLLINRGATLDTTGDMYRHPVLVQSLSHDIKIMSLLLDRGLDPNAVCADRTVLQFLASQRYTKPDLPESSLKNDPAAKVHLLVRHGADPNKSDSRGNAPLHFAAATNNVYVVRALLREKAKVNLPNKNGDTPLHVAASTGSFDTVRILLAAGADKHARNKDGKTPLDLAGDIDSLLKKGGKR